MAVTSDCVIFLFLGLVTFTDNTSHTFTFDDDVIPLNEEGMEYQKYQYFGSTPAESMPRRVHYYQFTDAGQVAAKQPYGAGCLGLSHDADTRPKTNTTIQLLTDNMPAGAGLGATVMSLTQINPGTDLTALGLTAESTSGAAPTPGREGKQQAGGTGAMWARTGVSVDRGRRGRDGDGRLIFQSSLTKL